MVTEAVDTEEVPLPTGNTLELLPPLLSPSRAKDFMQCPKLFYYKTICKMTTPDTVHTARGTLAHEAFELIFDHPAGQRTPELAVSYVRPAWEKIKDEPSYAPVVAEGPEFVEEMLASAERCVRSWFLMEDPNRFEPIGREVRVLADLLGASMHGYIDRLDRVVGRDGVVRWIVSDYKTGKPAKPQYQEEAFFAMHVYAALFFEMTGAICSELRLIYVREGHRDAILRQPVNAESIAKIKKKVDAVQKGIETACRRDDWKTKTGPLCNWCDFQDICPAFAPELAGMVTVTRPRKAA